MSVDSITNRSLIATLQKDKNKDAITNRIEFIKSILHDNKLEPIIDFNNTETENFMSRSRHDDDSGESFDTRVALKKKIFDVTDIISKIGGTLQYIKSGTTGHTFKGVCEDKNGEPEYEYAVKVVAYSIKDKYGDMYDTRRPENAELLMIKLLSYFIVKKKTPHIILPIGTFDTDIKHFTSLIEDGTISEKNEKYKEFVKRYKNGEYYDKVSILISEWANRGDFLDYVKKNYKRFTPLHWKVFFFQLISTLAVIQSKFPSFRHNDMKANNVLITKINRNADIFTYKVMGNIYKVPNIGYQIKIWDFDFACIPGIIDNKKVTISNTWSRGINVSIAQNRYYDVHYFFNTLIKKGFFPEILTDPTIPKEVKTFINSIVPPKYQTGDCVSEKGRILINEEYVVPVDILKNNPYFDEFRKEPKINSIEKSLSKKNKIFVTTKKDNHHNINNFLKDSSVMEGGNKYMNTDDIKLNNKKMSKEKKDKKMSKEKKDKKNKKEDNTLIKIIKIDGKKKDSKENKNKSKKNKNKKRNSIDIDDIDIDKIIK